MDLTLVDAQVHALKGLTIYTSAEQVVLAPHGHPCSITIAPRQLPALIDALQDAHRQSEALAPLPELQPIPQETLAQLQRSIDTVERLRQAS